MNYLLPIFLLLHVGHAFAQASCSSDKTAPLKAITERFTNADCESCWTKPLLTNNSGVTLDWIVPSPTGDDAPLSAAANRDAMLRLENLNITLPKEQQAVKNVFSASTYKIRVAHGLALTGYIGSSIAITQLPNKLPIAKNVTTVLLLTETIPKGAADTPIERNLVRNMLIESWVVTSKPTARAEKQEFLSRRPLSIPQGVNPDNLRVIGWVQDSDGQILAAAQSKCIELK